MCKISLIGELAPSDMQRLRSGVGVVVNGHKFVTRQRHGKIELPILPPCPPGSDPARPLATPAEPKARGGGAGPGAQESILLPELPCLQVVCPHRAPGPQHQLNTIISVSLFGPEPSKFRIVLNMFQMEILVYSSIERPISTNFERGAIGFERRPVIPGHRTRA